MKSISVLLSAVLITAISIAAIAIVLFTGLPAIERSKEALYFSEAKAALTAIDNALRTVLSEGQGSSRAIPVSVSAGQYLFDSAQDRVLFEMEQTSKIVERGIFKKEGNLYINTWADVNASGNSTDLTLENSRILIIINKTGSSSSYFPINTSSLIKKIRLKELSADLNLSDSQLYVNSVASTYAGTGYTSLSQAGENLREASAKAFLQTTGYQYEIYYTLRSNADFLLIEVKNANTSIANYTVYFTAHLGTNKNNDVVNVTAQGSSSGSIAWTTDEDFGRGTHTNTTALDNDLILVRNISYDGWSFNTGVQIIDSSDVTYNGTHFWVAGQTAGGISRYRSDGTYDNWQFDPSSQTTPMGIAYNGTHFWVTGTNRVFRYNNTGVYDYWNFSTSGEDSSPQGVTYNGTHFWIVGSNSDRVWRYRLDATNDNATYDNWNFPVGSQDGNPSGISFNGTHFWIVGYNSDRVWRYNSTGDYDGWNFSTAAQTNSPTGISYNGTYFWIVGAGDRVYRYSDKYHRSGSYLSNTTNVGTITSLKATWNLTNATWQQNITVELSTDGSTWLLASNNTQYTSSYGSGSALRYRVNFSTNDTSLTPYLHNLTLDYNYSIPTSTTDLCLYDTSEFSSPAFFALTSESLMSGSVTNYTNDYMLSLNSSTAKTYLTLSKGNCDVFRKHKPAIAAKTFLEALKAFSYSFNDTLQIILKYNNTDILSDLQFGKGSYQLTFKNEGYNETTDKQKLSIKILK